MADSENMLFLLYPTKEVSTEGRRGMGGREKKREGKRQRERERL